MLKYLLAIILTSVISPMGLEWDKDYKNGDIPEIKGYQYYYGDVGWGQIVFIGKEDIIGLETEIQLDFLKNKISSAVLILGPAGLNDYNCIRKYKKMVQLLNRKYGNYRVINEVKDPMIDDLIASTVCYPIRVGMQEIKTLWRTKKYAIEALLFGDEDGYYIEIVYTNLFLEKQLNKYKSKKILKKI